MEKRLFLLDAYALIYRAYFALIKSPRFTSAGENTSAVFGFVNTLEDLLRKENPTHIAACFDPSGPTFRHEQYEDYKAQRDKQPEAITFAVPYIKRILEAYHIPVVEVAGYEADDVIGTLSHRAAAEGYDVYMVTPDKDYAQLVAPHIFMYRVAIHGQGFEIRDVEKVCERYGIESPRQVIDLLALEGDASDNIPGCPGVGKKTAQKLIAEFGSVENLLENTDSLKGALRQKVADNADRIRQSKWLATICRDVPVEIDPASLERRPIDAAALTAIYSELEFKIFIAKLKAQHPEADIPAAAAPEAAGAAPVQGSLFDLPAEEGADAAEAPLEAGRREYRTISTPAEAAETVASAAKSASVGVAAYAVGDNPISAPLRGLALSTADGEGVYIHLDTEPSQRAGVLAAIAPLFSAGGPLLVSHDVKRAYLLLKGAGIEWEAPWFDTSVAHYVIDPERKHDLGQAAATRLRVALCGVPADHKPGTNPKKPLSRAEAMARYCEEADLSRRLRAPLEAEVAEREMAGLLYEVEFPLVRVLAEMEWTGVRIDPAALLQMGSRLKDRISEMEQEAYAIAGGEFNISSPSQVGTVLFDRMQIDPKAKKTAKGQYSTTEQILEKYAAKVPLVGLILKIRRLRKLVATYLDALPALINPRTGKIHTSFNQTVTATGRISSTNPNLQNIPVRTEDGREIRKAFIPDPGCIFMSADYSQIELRLIADLSGDKDMIEAFLSGDDIHRITAAKIYGVPLAEVTEDQRRHAKTANFGIIYGISAFGLSERLGIARSEAKALIDGYFATYPHIRQYLDQSVIDAREKGYVTTRMGRRRYLPEINSRSAVVRGYAERTAINAPVQGSAADIIKVAMVRIFNEMQARGLRSRMIMQVHDELIFNVWPDELEQMRSIVEQGMENAYRGAVPLIAQAGTGANWLEAH
ncbi:MAG: DNA polymerase I [Duncaniella sp.]|nr:DNA polymerase I [Duncaniella sp.]